MMQSSIEWQDSQANYWNDVADEYDSLYQTPWSKLENLDVQNRLKFLLNEHENSILDLGCGTGLGYEFFSSIPAAKFKYLGIDISEDMLSIAKQKLPSANFQRSGMSNLQHLAEEFDIVTSLFCSFSYEEKSAATVSEIFRVLNPGGKCFISMVNRFSLRRLVSVKFDELEMYTTRKSRSGGSAPARTFSKSTAEKLFKSAGFADVQIIGQGFLSGISEHACLWKFDRAMSCVFPVFTHMLTVVAQKPKENYQ